LRISKVIGLLGGVLVLMSSVVAGPSSSGTARPLPATIGKFKQLSRDTSLSLNPKGFLDPENIVTPVSIDEAVYVDGKGSRVLVQIIRFRQDAQAYQLLSLAGAQRGAQIVNNLGTAGYSAADELGFFKGVHLVRIKALKDGSTNLTEFAQTLSESLDKGEGDIPVLIKHLPSPEEAQKTAIYLNSFAKLDKLGLQQPVLSAIESGGNADAALATYGPSKVLVVEFNTPQLATDNDQRIIARIHELWKLGQPAPTAYRRVGNYSVFVFDAPDEQTAKQLIDQVKYEQVVQWLGDNPYIYKEAEERYVNTTLGVLIAVVKASGYALIGCLGMGGLIGGLLFFYRRAQQKGVTAFSDAGGMLRLNLDELTAESNPSRLLQDRN